MILCTGFVSLLTIQSVRGWNFSNKKENNIHLVTGDTFIGKYNCTTCKGGEATHSGMLQNVQIYEREGMCGGYYALVQGEPYKVVEGSWESFTGKETFRYSFVYRGVRYGFNF